MCVRTFLHTSGYNLWLDYKKTASYVSMERKAMNISKYRLSKLYMCIFITPISQKVKKEVTLEIYIADQKATTCI